MNFYLKWLVGTLIALGYVALILFSMFAVVWFSFEQPILGVILLILISCVLYGLGYARTARRSKDVVLEEYREDR